MPRSYQVTPAVLGRRRATQALPVRPSSRRSSRESARRPPENQPDKPDVAAKVVLPFDRYLHEGKEIGLDKLSKDSRRCYLELAAALADMFPSRAMAHDLGRGVGVRSPSR